MVKSPLRYPGGKSRAVKFLHKFIPAYKEFREVFFGGGSLSFYEIQLFSKYPEKPVYKASDLNYELYCFWSQLRTNSNQLIAEIQKIFDLYKTSEQTGRHLFETVVKRRNNNLTELQRAIDFFILNRITFSGVVDSGGYSRGSFDGRFTQTSIERLRTSSTIVKDIQFFCEDYTYLLKQAGNDVFIFLDPPYYSATQSKLYGKKGILHTSFDHRLLYECLQNSPHKWLVTYDNSSYIQQLYKDFYQVEWKLQYGMTNSNKSASVLGAELLIANYDIAIYGYP